MLHTHGFVIWWRVSESFRGRQQSDRRPRERGETHTPRPRVWHGGLTASAQANICGYGSLRSQRRRGPSCYRTLAFQIAAPRAKHTFAISRHDAPELCNSLSPNRRAQGMPGAHCARSLVCRMKKHTSIVTTVTPGSPGIPRAMVLTVSFVLSPATGLVCRRRPQDHHLTSLTPASGRHDHTTSPSARSALVRCATCVHRIPPRVRDDREPPLCGTGPNRNNPASTPVSSEIRKIRSHIAGIFSEYFRAGARQEICKTARRGWARKF